MRVKSGTINKNRHKKILNKAKGFLGGRHRLFRTAKNAVMKAGVFAYRDRRQKKRYFRKLWISRINAAVRPYGINYSQFIKLLSDSDIKLNRKSLAEIAVHSPEGFKNLVEDLKSNSNN
jgi:large subunit ribosomal protein L20